MKGLKRTLALGLCACLLSAPLLAQTSAQASYQTPEEAAQALKDAMAASGDQNLLQVLGPEAKELIQSGDQVHDTKARADMVRAFETMNSLGTDSPAKRTLYLGTERYPFPIPLVKRPDGHWAWNTHDGKEEIISRRIGRNELTAAEVLQAIAQAQREYALEDRNGDGVSEYATRIFSSPGTHDGLYWESQDGLPSPLGGIVAKAEDQGYKEPGKGKGYAGYRFHLLKGQGPNAPGGAYSYVINGHQVAGFAAVAWPMNWNETGVMTFIMGPNGRIYEKNLGPDTAQAVERVTTFDPGEGWKELK